MARDIMPPGWEPGQDGPTVMQVAGFTPLHFQHAKSDELFLRAVKRAGGTLLQDEMDSFARVVDNRLHDQWMTQIQLCDKTPGRTSLPAHAPKINQRIVSVAEEKGTNEAGHKIHSGTVRTCGEDGAAQELALVNAEIGDALPSA